MRRSIFKIFVLMIGCLLVACSGKTRQTAVFHPAFSADSAYQYITDQIQYGPRVPNTKAHQECAAYLMHQLRQCGAEVSVQHGTMSDFSGKSQPIVNIIGHFAGKTDAAAVLLCAHYDSRPWSDEEEDYADRFLPVPGANDGASGVGVLLEIARQLGIQRQNDSMIHVPVDIVFFDCEDMGTPDFYTGQQREHTWCLGSQFWANEFAYGTTQAVSDKYEFGILLDMVGAPNATFPKEYYSMQGAGNYVEKIWREAAKLGYQQYFVSTNCYPLIDDHYYVSSIAGIPCLDIIHYDTRANGFASWWHTQQDNMHNIDKKTLQAVGETVLICLNY